MEIKKSEIEESFKRLDRLVQGLIATAVIVKRVICADERATLMELISGA
jgi:hypothetical protein